jgi:hypothetical protein
LEIYPKVRTRISEVRREVAPLVGMSEDNLRVRTDQLYRQPALRAVLPGRRAASSDREGLLATAGATALVLLTGMLGYSRERIGPAVVRLWEANWVTEPGGPLKHCKTLGAALTLMLQHSDVRSRLHYFELDHDIPHFLFEFDRGSQLFYAPYRPDEWKRRIDGALAAGEMAHISRLPVTTLDKIAALIEQDR